MRLRTWASRWGLTLLLSLLLLGAATGADEDPPEDVPEAPPGKVQMVPNVGGHTGAIADMAFDRTGTRLYTVGRAGEVAEWNVKTGRRLRVWHVPGFAYRLAVAARADVLAASGLTYVTDKGGAKKHVVWMIDL